MRTIVSMKFPFSALPIAAIVLLAVGCSQEPPPPPEEVVAERAQARWDALVADEFEQAWDYYTPGFREQLPASDFALDMRRRPVDWVGAEVRSVECADDEPVCTVRVRVEYRAPLQVPGAAGVRSESGVTESWLQLDGDWWYSSEA
jgi:hypothetical protein